MEKESKTVLEHFFGNSMTSFVSQLNDRKSLSQNEIKQLQGLLDETSNKEQK